MDASKVGQDTFEIRVIFQTGPGVMRSVAIKSGHLDRRTFARLMGEVMARLAQEPDLHLDYLGFWFDVAPVVPGNYGGQYGAFFNRNGDVVQRINDLSDLSVKREVRRRRPTAVPLPTLKQSA